MDYFKIFTLIFMIFILYKLYLNEVKIEGFEGTTQSLGGVDDANSINTLAQIARKLMDKGLTVPGDMNINGNTNVTGNTALTGSLGVGTTLNVTGSTTLGAALSTGGNINARAGDLNTRIGGIWTAPGIYAEGNKNLEIGAGSSNVFIGAANGGANQNLIVTGNINVSGRNPIVEIDKIKTALKAQLPELLKSIVAVPGGGVPGIMAYAAYFQKYNEALNF